MELSEKNNKEDSFLPRDFLLPKKLDIESSLFEIKKENICKIMGMSEPVIDKYVCDLIEHYISECKSIVAPVAAYSIFKNPHFNSDKRTFVLEQESFDAEKIVYAAFKNSIYLAAFVCTCGNGIENLSKKLMKNGNSLEGYIVDLIGSEVAEEIANYVHRLIAEIANEFHFKVTNRYSPGYCNWPVSDQSRLFNLMKGNTCNIQLTSTSLMVPLKSVSGMIGIGPNVKLAAYKCNICADEKCILRKLN
jgi:hypothetical protein